jgi:hypothetical protein
MSEQNLSLSVKVNTETGALEVLGAKLKDVAGQAKGADNSFTGLGGASKELLSTLGLVATGAGILNFFKNAVTESNADAEALRRLSFTLTANGVDWSANKDKIMEWSKGMQELTRFSDTAALEALGQLSKATKDVSQAQEGVKVAMGLSVAAGMPLNQALDLMQGLMMGNQRSIMMAHRELGTFVGNAHTAQEMLDALSAKVKNAAIQEDSFSKSSEQLTNAWHDFSKLVGSAFIPALTGIITALSWVMQRVQDLGTVIAAFAVSAAAMFQGLGEAIKDAMIGHFAAAGDAIRDMNVRLVAIAEGAKDQIVGLEQKKTAAVQAAAAANTRIIAGAAITDLAKQKEQAAKIIEINADLHKKIDALGEQTLKKKLDALDVEAAAKTAQIQKEVEDKTKQVNLLIELENWKQEAAIQIARTETIIKNGLALDVAGNALEALAIINNMNEKDSQAQVNRAIMILALEKAIAIARIISSYSSLGPYAMPLAAAQIGLIVAQFAQQSQAVEAAGKNARASAAQTSQSFSQIQLPGGQIVQTGPSGVNPNGIVLPGQEGSLITPTMATGQVASGGPTVNVNIPEIIINVAVDTLEAADRRKILQALGDELRAASVEAIRFAVTSANLADTNLKVAV